VHASNAWAMGNLQAFRLHGHGRARFDDGPCGRTDARAEAPEAATILLRKGPLGTRRPFAHVHVYHDRTGQALGALCGAQQPDGKASTKGRELRSSCLGTPMSVVVGWHGSACWGWHGTCWGLVVAHVPRSSNCELARIRDPASAHVCRGMSIESTSHETGRGSGCLRVGYTCTSILLLCRESSVN